ncbi:putative phage protein p22 [Gammaproteobacteria bacterium]
MGTFATPIMAAALAGSTYVAYQGNQQAKSSAQQAQQNAQRQALLAEQDMNRANQKKPNYNALLSAALQAGKAGQSGTMLTGPQGVDPGSLTLGKNTLLGQ